MSHPPIVMTIPAIKYGLLLILTLSSGYSFSSEEKVRIDSLLSELDEFQYQNNSFGILASPSLDNIENLFFTYTNELLEWPIQVNEELRHGYFHYKVGTYHLEQKNSDLSLQYFLRSKMYFGLNTDSNLYLNLLKELGKIYKVNRNFDSAGFYFSQALAYSDQLEDRLGNFEIIMLMGDLYMENEHYLDAKECFTKAVRLRKPNEDKELARALNGLATSYARLENLDKALKYCIESYIIKKKLGDQDEIRSALSNIGAIYCFIEDYENGIAYLKKAVKIAEEIGDKQGLNSSLMNLSLAYASSDSLDNATEAASKTLALSMELDDKVARGVCYKVMSEVSLKKGEPTEALKFIQLSLESIIDTGYKGLLCESYNSKSKILADLERYNEAILMAKKGLKIAEEVQLIEVMNNIHERLYTIFEKQKDYKNAFYHLSKHEAYADSLRKQSNLVEIGKLESKIELDQKEKDNEQLRLQKLLHEQEILTSKSKISSQNTIIVLVVFGLLITLFSIHLLLKAQRVKTKRNTKLKALNREIMVQREEIALQAKELKVLTLNQESIIAQKTERIQVQNKKLIDYIYSNSHYVRGPLSRIMGLLNLQKIDPYIDNEEVFDQIDKSAQEMDLLIKDIAKNLESEYKLLD